MTEIERCGETLDGEMWPIGECALPAGHLGDHYAVVTWPRYERPDPSGPPNRWISDIWAKTIEQQLNARLIMPRPDPVECEFHGEPHPQLPFPNMPCLVRPILEEGS